MIPAATGRHSCLGAIAPCVVYLRLWEVTLGQREREFPALGIFNPLDAPVRWEVILKDRGMKTFPFQL